MTKTKIFLMLCIVFAIFSCSSDDDSSAPYTTNPNNQNNLPQDFGGQVQRDFIGQVVDVANAPLKNIAVSIGNITVQTDINGMFVINSATVNERFAYIKAKKSGYFDGSRAVLPTTGKNNVKITLVTDQPSYAFSSGSSTSIGADGTNVIFDGDFVDVNNVPYSGSIYAALRYQPPTTLNSGTSMPGMLFGVDESGAGKTLTTYGMLNVQARGTLSTQKLKLPEGHSAKLVMKIDNAMVANAPSTIPLWYFDGDAGYWKQEGIATKQGDKYVSRVLRLGWWNCGVPAESVVFTATVVDANQHPVANTFVSFSGIVTLPNAYTLALTDNNGKLSVFLPANENFSMKVTGLCGDVISSSAIGPFAADTNLSAPVVVSGTQLFAQGKVVDCSSANISTGYVWFSNGTKSTYAAVANGNYTLCVSSCAASDSFKLQAYDFATNKSTGTINYGTPSATETINLMACNSATGFISYQLDSDPVIYTSDVFANMNFANPAYNLYMRGNQNNIPNIVFAGVATTAGVYDTGEFSLTIITSGGSYVIDSNSTNTVSFNITNFGAIGTYGDIRFNGTFVDSGVTHTVSGLAHVKRSN